MNGWLTFPKEITRPHVDLQKNLKCVPCRSEIVCVEIQVNFSSWGYNYKPILKAFYLCLDRKSVV